MEFKPLLRSDLSALRPYFAYNDSRICDLSPGTMFLWRDFFQTEYAEADGALYTRLRDRNGDTYYNAPLAADLPAALKRLAAESDRPLRFCTVPEAALEAFAPLGPARIAEQTDFADYVYRAQDLSTLAGKKYSGQRNQISQFKRGVGEWSFAPIDRDAVERIEAFFRTTYLPEAAAGAFETAENDKVLEALRCFDEYGFVGGYLTADERVVGFSLNERVGDTLITHIEKADRHCKGAYQMVVNQTALAFAGDGVEYINREEDMGDPGLRTSKLSYHPYKLLKKYTVELG